MHKFIITLITTLCTTALMAAASTANDKGPVKNMEEQNISLYIEAPVFGPPHDMLNSREKEFVKYLSNLHEKVFLNIFNAVQREQAIDAATRLHPQSPSVKEALLQVSPDMAVELVLKSKRNPKLGKCGPQTPFLRK